MALRCAAAAQAVFFERLEIHGVQHVGAGVTDRALRVIAGSGCLLLDAFEHLGRNGFAGQYGIASEELSAARDLVVLVLATPRFGKHDSEVPVHGSIIYPGWSGAL